MDLKSLLIMARAAKATEIRLVAGDKIELLTAEGPRTISAASMRPEDIDDIVLPHLDARAQEEFKAARRYEGAFDVNGIGRVRATLESGKAHLLVTYGEGGGAPGTAGTSAGTALPPGAVPTLGERLRGLFGGKR